ncbi:MAG: retroviral-like aspartic protease family protein [Acidobacteria bacterium]|nr:retroviral-like aspartic protease family protein [Acidobacteriota bacterium]
MSAHDSLRRRVEPRRAAATRAGQFESDRAARAVPSFARFREVAGRGLIVRTWINDAGPFDFALDTGAGSTILSTRVAQAARVAVANNRTVNLSGLSGVRGAAREASLRTVAVGDARNYLPGRGSAIVADSLPPDLDGVLDPSETFYPLGYIIDFRDGVLRAFDPRVQPLSRSDVPAGGDVVAWFTDGETRRPFVALEGGRRALIDTGSGLGLGVTPEAAQSLGIIRGGGRERAGGVNDLARGRVEARRIEPATVRVGALVLRGVPTDLLAGATASAPVILGRDALRPFELTFDPLNRLIRFAPR